MKLLKNTWLTKLYLWFYASWNLPKTGCEYIPKFIFMIIFIIPFLLAIIPYIVADLIMSSKEDSDWNQPGHTETGTKITISIIFYILIYMIIVMIFVLFNISNFWVEEYAYKGFLYSGLWGWIISIIIGIIFIIFRVRKNKPKKIKVENPIITYLKAKRDKICIIIEWIED